MKNPECSGPKTKDLDASLLEELRQKFEDKQSAREERQHRFLREKEQVERQLNPLVGDKNAEKQPLQLEFDFSGGGGGHADEPPSGTDAAGAEPLPQEAGHPGGGGIGMPMPVMSEPYQLPPLSLVDCRETSQEVDESELEEKSKRIQETLDSFQIDADVTGYQRGPRITLFRIVVARGIKVETVARIARDLAMALAATSIRILAPMPGHDYVGVEVPNRRGDVILCGSFLAAPIFQEHQGQIPIVLGRNVDGRDVVVDLARAPHLLVAGATGSGKSVCLNNILMSLLYRFPPEDLRLILVDPKIVEFSSYKTLPHLVVPVITETELVVLALRWVIYEMKRRYGLLAKVGVRNLESFNHRRMPAEPMLDDEGNEIPQKLPFLVVIIDEMADIMLTARQDVESSLARIAQLSRAVGIHCIVATQRPSVNVITGVIKANFPTRIAFQVASQVDSRTILDGKGAESLLGRGDMLYKAADGIRMQRLQGPMITDGEIERVVSFCGQQSSGELSFDIIKAMKVAGEEIGAGGLEEEERDDADFDGADGNEALLRAAAEIIIQDRKASISYIQRRLKIGYNKSATLFEQLEKRHIVGPAIGSAPREILVDSMEEAFGDETLS